MYTREHMQVQMSMPAAPAANRNPARMFSRFPSIAGSEASSIARGGSGGLRAADCECTTRLGCAVRFAP